MGFEKNCPCQEEAGVFRTELRIFQEKPGTRVNSVRHSFYSKSLHTEEKN